MSEVLRIHSRYLSFRLFVQSQVCAGPIKHDHWTRCCSKSINILSPYHIWGTTLCGTGCRYYNHLTTGVRGQNTQKSDHKETKVMNQKAPSFPESALYGFWSKRNISELHVPSTASLFFHHFFHLRSFNISPHPHLLPLSYYLQNMNTIIHKHLLKNLYGLLSHLGEISKSLK